MNKSYTLDVVDADDGTEDKMLQLSEEFLADHDWRLGDTIVFTLLDDKSVSMVNKSWSERNEGLYKQIPLPLDFPVQDS